MLQQELLVLVPSIAEVHNKDKGESFELERWMAVQISCVWDGIVRLALKLV